MTAPPFIVASQLGLRYPGGEVLQGVELQIARGEFVSLVGPSGCGKTSLLRVIAGLTSATSGQLTIEQAPADDARDGLPPRAFVFQDPTLLPWRTVVDNIGLPLELRRSSRQCVREAAEASMRQVGLRSEDAAKYPRMLSGGMRMRVSLARALVTQPHILLLDEPFAALDDLLRQRLNEELLDVWQRAGWTSVFVTHNVAEAVFLSQRVLVMSDRPGTIRQQFAVPFAYPRDNRLRGAADFARLTGQISAALREDRL